MFILAIYMLTPFTTLEAQERLYWDLPESVKNADGGISPKLLDAGDYLVMLWQEFSGRRGTEDSTMSVKAIFSRDGKSWGSTVVSVVDNLPYFRIREVLLYSAVVDAEGRLVVAVMNPEEGIGIYRQTRSGFAAGFRRSAIIPQSPDVSDVNVAPKLYTRPQGGMMLFLTRKSNTRNLQGDDTLSIFLSTSDDAVNWSSPEPFIQPDIDRGRTDELNEAVLMQNFLPSYLAVGSREYVAFQSLREGTEGKVSQIYLKMRRAGGQWEAALPITELLKSSPEDDALKWDNQRPFLGLSADGEILLVWERSELENSPGIFAIGLESDGTIKSSLVERVLYGRNRSASPSILVLAGNTWIIWFDETGIRLASRIAPYNYQVEATSLDRLSPGSDRGSAQFPSAIHFEDEIYIAWQDSAGSRSRNIILRPDTRVAVPKIIRTNFSSVKPENKTVLAIEWSPPRDSSGILSYSWTWSREKDALPSRSLSAQNFGTKNIVYRIDPNVRNQGKWYFVMVVQDQAGNWSDPLRLNYSLDSIPPPPPTIHPPQTDERGYLVSNSFTISWESAEKQATDYYIWSLDYLAAPPDNVNFDELFPASPNGGITPVSGSVENQTRNLQTSWRNIDNGVWAFTVVAVDAAGNRGGGSTQILNTINYVPVTFISNVSISSNLHGYPQVRLFGRGFSVGGELYSAIIDRDGVEPWDYEYLYGPNSLETVTYDRVVDIKGIEEIENGDYLIGVHHPRRGLAFWNRRLEIDSTGTLKIGPFGLYEYESVWKPAMRSTRLSGNQIFIIIFMLFLASALVISLNRFVKVITETRQLNFNVEAVLGRQPLREVALEERLKILRRKGMGLRRKFILALITLIMITTIMITTVLGYVWVQSSRSILAEALENESRLMVETLASSARNSIPTANQGELLLLPERIRALSEALWTTVTGPQSKLDTSRGTLSTTSLGYEYVWASNDVDILDKISLPGYIPPESVRNLLKTLDDESLEIFYQYYRLAEAGQAKYNGITGNKTDRTRLAAALRQQNIMPNEISPGSYILDDEISLKIENIRGDVEQSIRDAGIERMVEELARLEGEYTQAALDAVVTLDFSNPAYVEVEAALNAQRKEIQTLLLEVSNNNFFSFPEFTAQSLRSGGPDSFVFYKPLLYQTGLEASGFFRGTVRLAVSVTEIREVLGGVRNRIIIITVAASIACLLLGFAVALFVSGLMISPIVKLQKNVGGVSERIGSLSDSRDPFDFNIKTGDEIQDLSETINGFILKLVQAELDQKELIAGQVIQKTFLPLEVDKESGVKLSTGGANNSFFKLFGYYEGADAVSGDYFDFRQLDEDHYVIIKLDISGHGVTASLIMVQVAALYVDYFRRVRDRARAGGKLRYDLREFTFGINDLINEVGFKGRFAAFNLSVMNVRNSCYNMVNAGDNLLNVFDGKTRKMKVIELHEAPATGQIDSMLIRNNPSMYQIHKGQLKSGDVMFLYTDGIEESHHIIRDAEFNVVEYGKLSEAVREEDKAFTAAGYKPIESTETNEEFDTVRIHEVLEAAMNRTVYELRRRCDLTIGRVLHFDFTRLSGNCEDAVMALASVEKVFRIVPDSSVGSQGQVRVDRKIDNFLKEYFVEYREFYRYAIDTDAKSPYVYFSHMREDPQDDDLTIWAYERL